MTGSTKEATTPLIQATHVLKRQYIANSSTKKKTDNGIPKQKQKKTCHISKTFRHQYF